jgi:dihydrofolate synthase/folylpolyglutamate synthase
MRFSTLPEWLVWQENLHFTEVDPGLERIDQVWRRLDICSVLPFRVVTVAGTNGKGSSVALLDSILCAAGYKTGTYTSPHLLRYNERIVIAGDACKDQAICLAFDQIDQARGEISLTYFEFATLAAIILFVAQKVDIAILEVGMGGRLDAVNLFDADITLITPISLDHMQWLGNDRETIAFEKAGVIRANKPVVCSEIKPPTSLLSRAEQLQAPVYRNALDFHYRITDNNWRWSNNHHDWSPLVFPALAGDYQIQNAAAVLQVVSLLIELGFIIDQTLIEQGLNNVVLAGRFQKVDGPIIHYFDVTHNVQGAENLVTLLETTPCEGRTIAVMAMLKDKDPSSVAKILNTHITLWYVGGLTGSRGLSGVDLLQKIKPVISDGSIYVEESISKAYSAAIAEAKEGDRVLVFGSFHTVESVMLLLDIPKY